MKKISMLGSGMCTAKFCVRVERKNIFYSRWAVCEKCSHAAAISLMMVT